MKYEFWLEQYKNIEKCQDELEKVGRLMDFVPNYLANVAGQKLMEASKLTLEAKKLWREQCPD